MAALDELGLRFTRFKKLITSDPLFKAACGYTRLTMMNANYEPFYLINFFIKKLPDARIAPSLLIDLGKKWAEIFEDEDPEPRCVRYYQLLDGAALARDAYEQLLTLPAYKITDVGQIKNRTAKILEEKTLRKQVIDNNQKGYLALFRLQSQVHNLIPGVRTLTHSNDFTYINTEVRKRRKSKKASIVKQSKSANADAVSIDKETSGLRTSADDSTSPIDHMEPEFYDILPSNLNAHLPKNPSKRPERKVTKDI
ncbi:hypothetical protein MXM51_10595 [Pantoea stewartii]|uniref:hypothetical protein n=1 Tax=Pantoea stewartii TaxID=66269 RepID=UPI002DBDBD8E|nr:hypothetical protein [Pantoea stewartii]MEB6534982.1 hypothetical protein [Pantoea stewartii]